jgi:hypothetical protein
MSGGLCTGRIVYFYTTISTGVSGGRITQEEGRRGDECPAPLRIKHRRCKEHPAPNPDLRSLSTCRDEEVYREAQLMIHDTAPVEKRGHTKVRAKRDLAVGENSPGNEEIRRPSLSTITRHLQLEEGIRRSERVLGSGGGISPRKKGVGRPTLSTITQRLPDVPCSSGSYVFVYLFVPSSAFICEHFVFWFLVEKAHGS